MSTEPTVTTLLKANMNTFKLKPILAAAQAAYFENSNDALIAELWAMESLLQLEKMSVMPWLVYRDFENAIAHQGQVVNAHRPAEFKVSRKGTADDIVPQDAVADTVPVALNQHLYTSFLIRDGEESKSFQDLIAYYLIPAMRSISEGLDKMLAGQVYNFTKHSVGSLGVTPVGADLANIKALLSNNRVPAMGRNGVLTAGAEAAFTSIDLFVGADKVGDEGTALREGSLGRKYGADFFTDVAMPSVAGATAGLSKTVDFTAGYPKGYTGAIVLDTGTAHALSAVVKVNGAVYTVSASSATSVTFNEPLRDALADGTTIYQNAPCAVSNNYAVGWLKPVVITGLRGVVGEAIRDAAGNVYSVVEVTAANTYLLDKPLVAAFTTAQVVSTFPDGAYNFVFHRDAIALVTRPLAEPRQGTGALSSVVEDNGISVRVVITYDGTKQGHLVTIDLLCGVTVLNNKLGAALLS